MTEEPVFLVTEVWLIPGAFGRFKDYRMEVNSILEKYGPQYIFYNHAFEWMFDGDEGTLPTGIEIVGFENEETARAALSELGRTEIKDMEKRVFSRVRCYLSRYAAPDGLKDETDS